MAGRHLPLAGPNLCGDAHRRQDARKPRRRQLMQWTSLVVAAAATLSIGTAAIAQSVAGFPSKPIKVLVPLAPGGGVDTVARKLGEKLGAQLGKPISSRTSRVPRPHWPSMRRRRRPPTATRWC
jgi:hypothetical protein